MISRRTTMTIASAYITMFSHHSSGLYGGQGNDIIYRDKLYDYLYMHEYEAWFCNMVKKIFDIKSLKEWLLRIHTGETLINATPNWPWEKREALGQIYLKNMARDFIIWYQDQKYSPTIDKYSKVNEAMIRQLEIDGYVFRDGELLQTEIEVLDVEAETGLLENLHTNLALADKQQTFRFLKLAEDHYIAGLWSDCIGNARKFLEAILQQVANKHSVVISGKSIEPLKLQTPVEVRNYLESIGLLEKKEKEAVDKIYGLLSHTGAHPYMAEKDQARLLRQISLTIAQFIMLRLEGKLKTV